MKILITAFEPFAGNQINYANEVLKGILETKHILKYTLPVEYEGAFLELKSVIESYHPTHIILLGEARKNTHIAYEVIAINEHAKTKDNKGIIPIQKRIIKHGEDGIFATLDYALFERVFTQSEIPFIRSYSAGTYVCNALLYQSLSYLKKQKLKIQCGFIHIPILDINALKKVIGALNIYLNAIFLNKKTL